MTTATLARGPPPMNVEEEEQLMDEDEALENSPGQDRRGDQDDQDEDLEETGNGLSIDDAEMNSEDGYSNGEAVDYSGHGSASGNGKGGSQASSDGDGDQDTANGSIQSYDEYHHITDRNGRNGGGSLYSTGAGVGGTGKHSSSAGSGAKGSASAGAKNGKSFICDICMKTFSNAANMRRHRVRHSGIKPFECRFCQKRFFRKDHMREHMNHKHNNTQMECYFCQQVFDKEKDLFQHVTRDHDVNPRELHCQYCTFSGTTIGRYLWHMTTQHPRKNSHYVDTAGDAVSMAPYALDDYDSAPETSSPTVSAPRATGTVRSSNNNHLSGGTFDRPELLPVKREYADYKREPRDESPTPMQHLLEHSTKHNSSSSGRYYAQTTAAEDNNSAPAVSSSRGGRGVRYVSLLPTHLLSGTDGNSAAAEDLSSYAMNNHAEDLTHPVVEKYNYLQKKLNGNSSLVAAAMAEAAAVAAQVASNRNSGSSNRRKSKAPVRMATSPEDGEMPNGPNVTSPAVTNVASSKRDRDHHDDGARNGSGHENRFTSMLEEVMSQSQQQRPHGSSHTQAEDLSLTNGIGLTNTGISLPSNQRNSTSQRSKVSSAAAAVVAAASSTAAVPQVEQDSDQKCPFCLIVYPDNVMYLLHKMLHTKEHPYRCAICNNQYPNRYEFYAHVVNHRQ